MSSEGLTTPQWERGQSSHRRLSVGESETAERQEDDWNELRKAALERAGGGSRKVVLPPKDPKKSGELQVADVDHLTRTQRKLLVGRTLETEDQDAFRFLTKVKARLERVGIEVPTVEVRFKDLNVEADVYVGTRGIPSVINSYRNFIEEWLVRFRLLKSDRRKFTILDGVSGIIPPHRICLLLGPPGSGKSTLLKALAGKLKDSSSVRVSGDITYNGHTFNEFVPERTSAYVNQLDEHMAELTVRETIDFSRRVQGAGYRAEELAELKRREKAQGIEPDPEISAFMEANAIEGKRESIETDYTLHILGLTICADTLVGSQMIRGISGGQKKRVTTGEMIAGPKKTLFMDEISTGLDSSTTFQIVRSLRDFVQLASATALIALLQPAPETFDLFDDILLLSEGHILYHGPREEVMPFFRSLGFDIPKRKGIPDFLQEVSGKKDQQQYWVGNKHYRYIPVAEIAAHFKDWEIGQSNARKLEHPFPKEASHKGALVRSQYALKPYQEFKALMRRELTLINRTLFIYVMKTVQVAIMGIISATLFLRTQLHPWTVEDANKYAAFTFFSLLIMLFNGIAEMSMTVERFPVYFKQRDNKFYTALSYCTPATAMRLPYSATEAIVWTVLTYFEVGLAPTAGRFFMFLFLLFLVHQWSVALFRMMGALCRNIVVANAVGLMFMLGVFLLGGFVITKQVVHPWVVWLYWISPMQYAQRALLINEFTAQRWQNRVYPGTGTYGGMTLGNGTLAQYGFPDHYFWCWIAVGVLVLGTLLFNIILVWAHQHLGAPGEGQRAVVSEEQLLDREVAVKGDQAAHLQEEDARGDTIITEDQLENARQEEEGNLATDRPITNGDGIVVEFTGSKQGSQRGPQSRASLASQGSSRRTIDEASRRTTDGASRKSITGSRLSLGSMTGSSRRKPKSQATGKGLVLPFEPMTMTFNDLHYYVDLPPQQASSPNATEGPGGKKELELLCGINGAFRPQTLTALMGVTGAGKTTLMDVLAGRKTGGRITGDVRLNGFPKEQDSFARVSGYVEQFDIHHAFTTVHEALQFSAHLRFGTDTPAATVEQFITEVMALVELDSLSDALVGRAGQSGLSVEQRKRLTIAVELVANPSIVFMDEPTSGLDARAAAIVMRTVRNIVNTGRTIVCTIHQPSIDIFEAFDELLLLKRGGETIYCGPLGEHSADLITYFGGIQGVPPIKEGLNPATWMLEVSTPGAEQRTGVNFADVYKESEFARDYQKVIDEFSQPKDGAKPLHFPTVYAKPFYRQYSINFWRFMITYWRTVEYNSVRYLLTVLIGLAFGFIFWKLGGHVRDQLGIQNVLGALYATVIFLGIINSIVLQPIAAENRGVMYRERAAGMYAIFPWVAAMNTVEVVYCTVQAALYTCIVYFACGFARDAAKFFWFLLYLWQLLLFFTLFGLTAVALTPNIKVAAVLSSNFYSLFNLFAGFIITQPQVVGWWIWLIYINPCYWCIYGLVASQVGDFTNPLQLGSGEISTPKQFILQSYGYKHDFLGQVVAILMAWLVFLFVISYLSFRYINHLKR